MIRFLKYLIIPVLIVVYLFFVDFLTQYNPAVGSYTEKSASGGTEIIGVGESVTVSVTRPYIFGLIRLPIYTSALGDISGLHNLFFNFIIFLTAIFVIIDIIHWRRGRWTKAWQGYSRH